MSERYGDGDVHRAAREGVSGASARLPHASRIQQAFGKHDIFGVRAQVGGRAAEASASIGAKAYAMGDRVGFSSAPDLHTAAHEAAHVVQQRSGAVSAGVGSAGDRHEQHADRVADLVASGKSAEASLSEICGATAGFSPAVQRVAADVAPSSATATTESYTVQSGDTLQTIAARFAITVAELKAANTAKLKVFTTASGRKVEGFNAGELIDIPIPAPAAEPATAPGPEAEEPGLFESITGAVSDAVSGVVETITDAVSGLVDGLFAEDGTEIDPGEVALDEEVIAEPEVSSGPAFLDQRDNEFTDTDSEGDAIHGDNLCSVTSQTMLLVTLLGSEEAVKVKAAELIGAHGGSPAEDLSAVQTEDVVMAFYDRLRDTKYWNTLAGETTDPFYQNWTHVDAFDREVFHQMGACQAHVNQLFGLSSRNTSLDQDIAFGPLEKGATLREFHETNTKARVAAGEVVMLSTTLTGGHVVLLVSVESDGMIVNDPYGARRANQPSKSRYLLHGEKPSAELDSAAIHGERFKHNSELSAALAVDEPRTNWGERNFFSWSEVEKWEIGDATTTASTGEVR